MSISSSPGAVQQLSANHKTNLDGRVEESTLANGIYTVAASAQGFIDVVRDIEIACENVACEDCNQSFDIELEPLLDIVTDNPVDPDDTTKVIGQACPGMSGQVAVRDELTGLPLSGAIVNVDVVSRNEETGEEEVIAVVEDKVTGEDGLVDVPLTVNGVYQVTALHDGYDESVLESAVDCHIEDCSLCALNMTVAMSKDTNTVCQDVEMKVHIRDEMDQPVEGAQVNVFISGQDAPLNEAELITDASGEVFVTIPETGEFTVNVEAAGRLFLTANKNVTCDPEKCEACNPVIKFTVEEEPVVTEPPICNDRDSVLLTINIFDFLTESQIPSARAVVTMVPEHDELHDEEGHGDHVIASDVAANEEGTLTLEITENGEYTVTVSGTGYLSKTNTVTIQCDPDTCDDCSATLEMPLEQDFCPSTVFTVEVVDEATTLPVEGATVQVSVKSGNKTRPVSNNLICKSGLSEARQINDCGYFGIRKNECMQRGCCWDDTIEEANYCYFMEEEEEMLTDENGIVSIPISGKGDYKVKVKKSGFQDRSSENEVSCPIENSCDECSPTLRMSVPQDFCNNTVQLKVHVIDENQHPVEAASVNLVLTSSAAGASSSNVGGELQTDANGLVAPFVYESGTYMVSVNHQGYEAFSVEATVNNNSCVDQEIPVLVMLSQPGPTDQLSTLPPTCTDVEMVITVVDNITSQAISGVSLTISSGQVEVAQRVMTDQNGNVKFPISMNGEYDVVATKEGYNQIEGIKRVSCTTENNCACDTNLTMSMDQPRCQGDHPMVLPVTVRDNVTNTPLPSSLVTLVLTNSLSGSTQMTIEQPKYTDAEGFTNFTVPVNGDYSLQVESPGYVMKEVPVDVTCSSSHCEACVLSAPVKLNAEFCVDKTLKMTIRNAVNNSLVSDVRVVVSLETYSGPRQLIDELVGQTGEVEVPLVANGLYTSKVSKPGFVTMERMFEVDISMDECELFDPVELTPLQPTPPHECVRVSLSWGEEPQDLDLYSYRVNSDNVTDTCLTYYCNGKDPCNGTAFNIDNKSGGLNGSETITYCETEEYTNMVYVDDLSGKGASLMTSQARLSIVGAGRTEEVILNPSEAVTTDGSRYWLAGCLSTTDSGRFEFAQVNKFSSGDPTLEEPLNCHNRGLLQSARSEYTQTLANSNADITVKDAETDTPLADTVVTLANARSSYSLLTDQDGKVTVPIKENGNYTLMAQKDDYVAEKINVAISCDSQENCSVPLSVSMVPISQAQGIQVLLEWENMDQDLDLHVMQVNSLDNRVTCETSFSNMDGCKDTSLNHNIRNGGESEIVSIKNVAANSRFTFMVFAEDNSINGPVLSTSEGVTVTVTDGVVANIEDLALEPVEDGSKFWFVGCIKIVGETFIFETVDKFSRESPSSSNKLHCDSLFKQLRAGPTVEPFCPNVDLSIRVRNSLTNEIVPNATVSVIRLSEDDEVIITEGHPVDNDGQAATLVNQNGHYTVKVEADGFITSERDLQISCDIAECDQCSPSVFIPLSPTLEPGTMRLSLSWGARPLDLDFQVFRRTWNNWDDECRTYFGKKTGCGQAVLDLDNTKGGNNGAETISLKEVGEQEDNVYMVFVQDYSAEPEQFKTSEAHISITDGRVSHSIDLQPISYKSEQYWLAGCIRFQAGSYEFMPLNVFFNSRPSDEVPDMCLENFGYQAPTTKKPWYKFWG